MPSPRPSAVPRPGVPAARRGPARQVRRDPVSGLKCPSAGMDAKRIFMSVCSRSPGFTIVYTIVKYLVDRSVPRPTTRAERALATRRRMVKAAHDLFCTNGYSGTTINAVAKEAGVAVPTLYYTFGTKAALLSEALGARDRRLRPVAGAPGGTSRRRRAIALARPGGPTSRPHPTSADALDIFITNGVEHPAAGRPPDRRPCMASTGDPGRRRRDPDGRRTQRRDSYRGRRSASSPASPAGSAEDCR